MFRGETSGATCFPLLFLLLLYSWEARLRQRAISCQSLLLLFLIGHAVLNGYHNPNFAGDSRTLVTGSADATVKLWDVESGRCLFTFDMKVPVKSTEFSVGENLLLITTDPFMGAPSQIHVKRIAKDVADRKPARRICVPHCHFVASSLPCE